MSDPLAYHAAYRAEFDRLIVAGSDEEVVEFADSLSEFSYRAHAIAALTRRQLAQGDLAGVRASLGVIVASITCRTSMGEFIAVGHSWSELVRLAAHGRHREAALEIADLAPGDGARAWMYRELRPGAEAERRLKVIEQRLAAQGRQPREGLGVHEQFGVDFYPLLRERLLAEGHADAVARMERTRWEDNVAGGADYMVWFVPELTALANAWVERRRLPDEQLRLLVRYVYLAQTAFRDPSSYNRCEPYEALHTAYFAASS